MLVIYNMAIPSLRWLLLFACFSGFLRSQSQGQSEGFIRLVGKNSQEGRIEIFHNGEWGTVCDDDFDILDARVICRQLGYSKAFVFNGAHFGAGSGRIWLDDVRCRGDEPMIAVCRHRGWGSHNCGHGEDAGVRCLNRLSEGYIRLVGENFQGGRVEIYRNNEWGTLCDNDFDILDARVICRQLGYTHAIPLSAAFFGEGSGRIWLDNIRCRGDESTIAGCRHDGWGSHSCGHDEDAGVRCWDNTAPPYGCNFESGLCEWTQVNNDDFDWTRRQGPTDSSGTGPLADHTLGTANGYYVFIETSSGSPNDTALLVSPVIGPTNGTCLQFWYHMYGSHVNTLNVYIQPLNQQSGLLLWTRTGARDNHWYSSSIKVVNQSPFRFLFEGVRGVGAQGDIAIDDIVYLLSPCGQIKVAAPPYDCNFESGSCNWTKVNTGNLDWTRRQGPTGSSGTGPSVDHTLDTGLGHYVSMDTSLGSPNDTALLVSPIIGPTIGACLHFWYYMYGTDIVDFKVYIESYSVQSSSVLWSATGTREKNQWTFASVNVVNQSPFSILFEGVRGVGSDTGVAVDDIVYLFSSCGQIKVAAPPYDCNFESGLCKWTPVFTGNIYWHRYKARNTNGIGPSTDQTIQTGNGYYLRITTYSQSPNSTALLRSPIIVPTDGACLNFWYHGKSNASLQVLIQPLNQLSRSVLWTRTGARDNQWYSASVNVVSKLLFHILFAGTRDTNGQGGAAVDDIAYLLLPCGQIKVSAPPYDCNFESGSCNWTKVNTGNLDWTRRQGLTGSSGTGPSVDHTLDTGLGHYVSMDTSLGSPNDTALLVSPVIGPTIGACLHFWYYMYGTDIVDLKVYIESYSVQSRSVLWSATGTRDKNQWTFASVNVVNQSPFRILFEGVRGVGSDTGVAVDDIVYLFSSCGQIKDTAPPYDCNFESGLCDWTQVYTDDFDWTRRQGPTGSSSTGPSVDHTLGTANGYYVYIRTSSGSPNDTALLVSPVIGPTVGTCLQFWYHMYGSHVNTLNVYIHPLNQQSRSLLWTRTGARDNHWYPSSVKVVNQSPFRFLFEGVRGVGHQGDIAVDDIVYLLSPCGQIKVSAPPYDCNFESGSCNWTKVNTGNLDWIRRQGPTGSSGTGPSVDHTLDTGLGHYVSMDTSLGSPNDTALLVSPIIGPTIGSCLHFWYYMYGTDIVDFKVYIESYSVQSRSVLWSATGTRENNQWTFTSVNVVNQSPFRILFEGVRGVGSDTGVAVDDIVYLFSSCGQIKDTAPPYDCNFESGLCEWTHVYTDDFDWTRHQGPTGSSSTGPSVDHTLFTANGYYVYIETSSGSPNDTALLVSPVIGPTNGTCLQFWYHMYGSNVNTLNVFIQHLNQQSRSLLWTRTGARDNHWYPSSVKVVNQSPFRFLFEGVRGVGYQGDIAVDDIVYLLSPCGQIKVSAPPYDCNFESGSCNWTKVNTGNLDWIRRQGPTGSSGTGPSVDHTLDTGLGHYVSMDTSLGSPNDTALLVSPIIGPTIGACLHFWYFLYGTDIVDLKVYIESYSVQSRSVLWSGTGTRDKNQWTFASVNVVNQSPFRILFEGVRGVGRDTGVAVDDIVYLFSSCGQIKVAAPPYDCNFESGLCKWTLVSTGGIYWHRYEAQNTNIIGPSTDQTIQTGNGYYLMIRTNSPSPNSTALLRSPIIVPTDGACLNFWYHGKSNASLQVLIQPLNQLSRSVLWTRTGARDNQWYSASVNVVSKLPFHILFDGTRDTNGQGGAAVDDIAYLLLPCGQIKAPPYDCNFESDFCNWTNANADSMNWTRHQGPIENSNTGPSIDHTLGTVLGHYVYMETSLGSSNDTTVLVSPIIGPTIGACLHFWYFMYGTDIIDLKVYMEPYTRQSRSTLWSATSARDIWIFASVNVANQSPFRILFEGVRGVGSESGIAVDDIAYLFSPCRQTGADAPPYDCNFEYGFCKWTQGNSVTFNWTRSRGPMSLTRTGPSYDRTFGTAYGYYVSILTSSKSPYDTASLVSPTIGPTVGTCLHFWFRMIGFNSLNVYIKPLNKQLRSILWKRTGARENHWYSASVNFVSQSPFRIIFEGVPGGVNRGYIAIDDIAFSYSTPKELTVDRYPYVCNFESGFCEWSQVNTDDFDWTRHKGPTASSGTGPSVDHTFGTALGHFAYIETSSGNRNDKAILKSPTIEYFVGYLKFWYHMFGSTINTLNVYIQHANLSRSVLWTRKGDQGNHWYSASVNVSSQSPIHILFEGIRGSDLRGDIAIDDIALYPYSDDISTEDEYIIRLVGGGEPWRGRLEIRHNGQWGTVCEDGFSTSEAVAVCNKLGFSSREPQAYQGAVYGSGSSIIWYDEIRCPDSSTETLLRDCTLKPWSKSNCDHSMDVSVNCFNDNSTKNDGVEKTSGIRLKDGVEPWNGRLEVFHDGIWGTVSDEGFGVNEAHTVCRELNFDTSHREPIVYHTSRSSSGRNSSRGPIWLRNVKCPNKHSSLKQCSSDPWGTYSCWHSEDVSVDCVQARPSINRAEYRVNSADKNLLEDGTFIQVKENDNVLLTMDTDAYPASTVRLFKEQDQLEGQSTSSLNVNYYQVKCQQTGTYTFEAKNRYNADNPLRRLFNINVNCVPREQQTPKSKQEYVGRYDDTVILSEIVISYPAPTVTWNKSVQAIPVAKYNEYTYRISGQVHITGEDDYGVYTATVKNTEGELLINFFVCPEAQPSIIRAEYNINSGSNSMLEDGTSVQVKENNSLLLTMVTDANPAATVRLFKDQDQMERESTTLLNVNYDQVQCEQTGTYTFEARNQYNADNPLRRQFSVAVHCVPREQQTPKSKQEYVGRYDDTVILSEIVISYPAPTVTWNKSVQAIPVAKYNEYTYRISGQVLITGEDDYGVYTATVRNTEGELVINFFVCPEAQPSIIRAEYNINSGSNSMLEDGTSVQVKENNSLLLTMVTDANPAATVRLFKDQDQMERESTTLLNVNYDQVQCEQTGTYTFEARNQYNADNPLRRQFSVAVHCVPREQQTPKSKQEYIGRYDDTVILSEIVISYPAPTVTWHKSVQAIPVAKYNEYTYRISGQVHITGEDDYGVYTATIKNTEGELIINFFVCPEAQPSIIRAEYNINSGSNSMLEDRTSVQVKENNSLLLTMVTDANPAATVRLFKDQDQMEGESTTLLNVNYDQVQCEQTGTYTFEARNQYNADNPLRRQFSVAVHCIPRERSPKTKRGYVGKHDDTVILSEMIISYPAPNVTWNKNTTAIPVAKYNDYTYRISGKVHITGDDDYGVYIATIKNDNGDLDIKFVIRPEENSHFDSHTNSRSTIYSNIGFIIVSILLGLICCICVSLAILICKRKRAKRIREAADRDNQYDLPLRSRQPPQAIGGGGIEMDEDSQYDLPLRSRQPPEAAEGGIEIDEEHYQSLERTPKDSSNIYDIVK